MAIAHRATESAAATASTDDGVTITAPTGLTDGDLLLCWVSTANQAAITPPAGWTELASLTGVNGVYFGMKIAASEGASYAFTWTNSRGTGIVTAFSGVDQTNPIITYQTENASSASVFTALALDVCSSDPTNAMLVSFMNWDIGGQSTTAPTSYTIPTNGNPDSGTATGNGVESAVAYLAYSGGGMASAQWNGVSSRAHQTMHLALLPDDSTDELVSALPGVPTSSASTDSLAVTMPPLHLSGDLIVCTVAWRGDGVTASMTGWTLKGSAEDLVDAAADYHIATYYKYATSASESGTVDLSSANAVTVTTVLVKRVGSSGDPYADYQTNGDTTVDTASDFSALTVSAQDMLLIASIERRADNIITAVPTGYATFADPHSQAPLFARPSTSSGVAIVGTAVKFQTTADPAAGSFTHSASAVSVGVHGAITVGTAASATTRFFAYIIG